MSRQLLAGALALATIALPASPLADGTEPLEHTRAVRAPVRAEPPALPWPPDPVPDHVDQLAARPDPPDPPDPPDLSCGASWYGPGFAGRPTASGATFDPDGLTAASRDLPLGTILEVHHRGATVTVEVNDRGPFTDPHHRCLDLSRAAFARLAPLDAGVIDVTATIHTP